MQIDMRDLGEGLEIAAGLVALYGDEFLPAFLRLEREVEAVANRHSARDRALALRAQVGNYRAIKASAPARPASAPPSP